MTGREALNDPVRRLITEHMDARYADSTRDQCKALLDAPELAHLREHPNSDKINRFVVDLLVDLSMEVYREERDEVLVGIGDEVTSVFDSFFTDEEADQAFAFFASEVGKKIARNMD